MGFWDKVKSVANSAKCITGWHAGEYRHIQGKPKCFLEKTCPDCNEYVTKNKHVFSDWKYADNSINDPCDAIRTCIHCDHLETKVMHTYEVSGKDSSCRLIEKCNRCADEKLGKESHDWISIMGHEVKIKGQKKCKDCGTVQSS